MACGVCEHCADPVCINERTLRNGYSYHRKCTKCYLCSETNLQDSEVFQGFIICSSCSNRIFHTISPSRRPNHKKSSKQKYRSKEKLYDLTSVTNRGHDVIDLAKMVTSISSNASSLHILRRNERPLVLSSHAVEHGKRKHKENYVPRKCSAETEMSTQVIQELFKRNERPIPASYNSEELASSPRSQSKRAKKSEHNYFSDMRIAELGASTEIANMGLRKKSNFNPYKVKSVPSLTKTTVSNTSILDSDISGDGNKTGTETTYSTLSSSQKKYWMDRRIKSMVKLPFKSFKRNILRRSSFVSALMTVEEDKNILEIINMLFHEEIAEHHRRGLKRLYSTINRRNSSQKLGWQLKRKTSKQIRNILEIINMLFHEEIAEHHRRGLKRLYSTINRRNSPQKLGWLQLKRKTSKQIRCKHIATSHSYRCMRAHVMRMAGPTKSELAVFRAKVKKLITPVFVWNISPKGKNYLTTKMSRGCGNEDLDSKKLQTVYGCLSLM